ncbi:hypothetical protein AB1K09_20270 [Solibacillus silvestris]
MTTIHPHHLAFVKEAQEWRDKAREKGNEPRTYRNESDEFIALFMDDCDDIQVYELGPEVAYFTSVNENTFNIKGDKK